MWSKIGHAFSQHKAMRRILLFWSMWISTVAILRVTEPEVITQVPVPAATIIVTVIGLVTTFGAIYTHRRHHESKD